MPYQSILGGAPTTSAPRTGGYQSIVPVKQIKAVNSSFSNEQDQLKQLHRQQLVDAATKATAQVKQNTTGGVGSYLKPDTLIHGVGEGARQTAAPFVQSEKTTAQGIARVLPGGTSDLKAASAQAQSAANNTKLVNDQVKAGKMTRATASKILSSSAQSAGEASNNAADINKKMPTRGQLASGLAGTAADVLSFGTLPELKGIKSAAFGAAGGLNSASGGGTKKQIIENTAIGAALPAIPSAGRGIDAIVGRGASRRAVNNATVNTILNKVASKDKITVHSGGDSRYSTENKDFAKTFADDTNNGKVATKQINKSDILDTRNPEHRTQLESIIGKDKADELINKSQNGLPNKNSLEEEKLLTAAGNKLGYKHVAIAENGKGEPKFNGQDVVSYADTEPKTKLAYGEEGSGPNPAKAIQDVQGMLEKHKQSTKFSGNLEKNYTQLEGSKKVIAEDTAKLIKNRQPLSNADKQTLQDFRDAKAAGLTPKPLPEKLVAHDQSVTELNKAAQSHDAELARLNGQEAKAAAIEARNPETYTHREAASKGGALDYILQGDRKNPLSVSGLSKSKPANKSRTMMAVTDEQGNRRVVSVKNQILKDEQGRKLAQGKLVQAIDNGGKSSENLGKLKFNTNQDFLDKELSPYQTKIKNLQKEGDALAKVKAKGGVSDARINALAHKAALLEDARNFSTITKAEARSLRQANLKLKELTRVKPVGTTAEGRLKTINQHLIEMNNKINDIHNKYDPENLDKKLFVSKDGKKYTIGQATQSEITKATGQKYYTDPHLLAAKNYAESRTALENARFIDSIKQHPNFDKFASQPGQTAPKGWKGVDGLFQFMGYKFDPKIAEVLSDIVKKGSENTISDQVGNVLKQTIVYFPLKHSLNETATYAVDRGLSSLVNPMAYKRGAMSIYKAFHDVTNMSDDFMAAQKAGLHTVTGGDKALNDAFGKELKGLSEDKNALADIAKTWGSSPKRVYQAIQNVTVWQLQDILNMARVNEHMAPRLVGKGSSLEEAVAKTQKFNLQYSVPSRVGPRVLPGKLQRGLSNTLQSKKIFFGRYRYDLFRITSNMIKDSINLKTLVKNPKQNAQAVDKLAALALASAIVWPYVDKGIQKISGNAHAYMKAPGVLELPSEARDVQKGKKTPNQVLSNQLFISSGITAPLDLKNNRDSFTGKQIYDPNASKEEQFKSALNWTKNQLAPAQTAKQVQGAGGSKWTNAILALASVRFPKNSPETNRLSTLKYDTLPNVQSNAKSLAASGDTTGAVNAIREYDTQVLASMKIALKASGLAIPDDKTLIAQLKQQGYYYNPTLATVNGWKTAPPKSGTLQTILGSTPTPKKGEPGYLEYQVQQKIKSRASKFQDPALKQGVIN